MSRHAARGVPKVCGHKKRALDRWWDWTSRIRTQLHILPDGNRASAEMSMRQPPTKPRPLLGLLVLAAFGFWALVDDRFQTLSTRPSDVVVIAAVAILLSLLWQARAKRLETRDLLTWNFGLWVVGSAFGLTALLLITNASFDRGSSMRFATILNRRMCGRWSCDLRLVGAPSLPLQSASVTIRDNFSVLNEAQVGDTVFVSVKPGFLKRPWVSATSFHRIDRAHMPCFLLSRAAANADTVAIAHLLAQGASIDASDSLLYCDTSHERCCNCRLGDGRLPAPSRSRPKSRELVW